MSKIKFFFIIFICFFCFCNNKTKSEHTNYLTNYLSLIDIYKKKSIGNFKTAEQLYKAIVHIANKNFKIQFNFVLIKNFDVEDNNGLPSYHFISSPLVLNYPALNYVFNNGDLWFSAVDSYPSLYQVETDKVIRNKSVIDLYIYSDQKEILHNGSFLGLIDDKRNFELISENNDVTIKYNDFPSFFNGSILLSPILTDLSIWRADFPLKYFLNYNNRDKMFMLYNWKSKKSIKEIILPATGNYHLFGDWGIGQKDLKERIYLHTFINFNNNYPGMTEGHIMIYDMLNDTMYNIRHPLMPDAGEDEELLETNYILGEDENIYYQLVTDKAYYIYKIEPLWDEPMEETDYNPVFFEFYPELKAEWDKLQEQTE